MKSTKFWLAGFGLLVGAVLLIMGRLEAAKIWGAFFGGVYAIYAGANQVQKFLQNKK